MSPGTLLAPQGAPGTGNMKTGHSATPPPGTKLEPKMHTFPFFGWFLPTYLQSGVCEGFRVDFSWILDDLLVDFWMILLIALAVHRTVGNVVWIHY